MAKVTKSVIREEVKNRIMERGFKVIVKSTKKFWAVKNITKKEIKSLLEEITALLKVIGLDGGSTKPITFSYALLNETKSGAAGISIEI